MQGSVWKLKRKNSTRVPNTNVIPVMVAPTAMENRNVEVVTRRSRLVPGRMTRKARVGIRKSDRMPATCRSTNLGACISSPYHAGAPFSRPQQRAYVTDS